MECRFVSTGCVAIRPEGDVSPCLPLLHTHRYYFRGDPRRTLAYRVGNIHQTPLAQIWAGGEYRAFRDRVRRFEFSPCIDCCGCHFRETNQEDCYGSVFPRCGECLWAAGLVQCP
jgi:MoaA/NifB/PqqE/SkfB family radical SAM enzyme